MIKINLLPSEERATRRKISLPTVSGGAILWVSLGVFVYAGAVAGIWVLQSRKITDYETKIQALKEESSRLAPQLAKIRKLTAEREEVNKRLGIIAGTGSIADGDPSTCTGSAGGRLFGDTPSDLGDWGIVWGG